MQELSREELLELVRKLNQNKSDQAVSTELENVIKDDEDVIPIPCWKRARQNLPRLNIVAGNTNYLLPWYAVSSVEANKNFTSMNINTSLGMCFKLDSKEPQKELFQYLQIEMVKAITDEADGVKIRVIEEE